MNEQNNFDFCRWSAAVVQTKLAITYFFIVF